MNWFFNIFKRKPKCLHKNYVKHNWFSFDRHPMTCIKCLDCKYLFYDYVQVDRENWKSEVVWVNGS